MTQVQARGIEAFESLYDRYAERAYRVARSVCRDASLAEDAVQDAFVAVWTGARSYRADRGTVAAWLLTTVRYRAIDATRRNAERIGCLHAQESRCENVHELLDQTVAREDAARLQVLLKRLPNAQREVITLAFYGQLTHSEIATHLALPAGTVKGRMRLGLQKLRADIESAAPS